MNIQLKSDFWNSIRFKLVLGLLIFLIPFFLLLAYDNFYVIKVIHRQVAASNKIVVSLYLKQIDNNLKNIDMNLADYSALEADLSVIENSYDETEYNLALLRLINKINSDISIYKYVDDFFIYSYAKRDMIDTKSSRVDYKETNTVNSFIQNMISTQTEQSKLLTKGWKVTRIGGAYYLLRIIRVGNTYAGAWLRASNLLIPISESDFGTKSISVFVDANGSVMSNAGLIDTNGIELGKDLENYYITGKDRKYLIVGDKSSEGEFSLAAITPEDRILSGSPYIQNMLTIIAVATAIFLPLYLLLLRKTVLVPLKRILLVMRDIEKGNMDKRIKPKKTSYEFSTVNNKFNDMLDQISKLKIDIYEEKINRQKAELEHLQLQVKPHFFLNSLNIMNTLARTKDFDLLQKMCTCLIEYFRYMFRSNMSYVSLEDELKHVQNYIRIQEMRYPQKLSSEITAPECLLSVLIPPLLLHTFVENSVKYSMAHHAPVHLAINISMDVSRPEEGVIISVSDTGIGFRQDILEKLQKGDRIVDKYGEHIGIRNIQKRLSMLYKGKASITLGNSESGGAVIKIWLPLNQTRFDEVG